jgi:hypothetical protein
MAPCLAARMLAVRQTGPVAIRTAPKLQSSSTSVRRSRTIWRPHARRTHAASLCRCCSIRRTQRARSPSFHSAQRLESKLIVGVTLDFTRRSRRIGLKGNGARGRERSTLASGSSGTICRPLRETEVHGVTRFEDMYLVRRGRIDRPGAAAGCRAANSGAGRQLGAAERPASALQTGRARAARRADRPLPRRAARSGVDGVDLSDRGRAGCRAGRNRIRR